MLVYRSDSEERPGAAVWQEIVRQAARLDSGGDREGAVGLLVSLGEAESAIADRLFPECDGVHHLAERLRAASVEAAHLVLSSQRRAREAIDRRIEAVRRRLAAIPPHTIPNMLSIPVSEGYAYYALHPETYAEAARLFLADGAPSSAIVIGIRSIGTSLSAIVAAALEAEHVPVRTCSVRPRGHPFERHLAIDAALRTLLAQQPRGAAFLVVDEGPGLSGSSFAAAVTTLTELGVEAQRIVLFPSWNPDGAAFRSETARRVWQRHRRYCRSAPEVPADALPFSWRPLLCESEGDWPPTHPQHERVKWIVPEAATQATQITRFAGLAHYGVAKHERAAILAEHGLGPAPIRFRNGYLTTPFVHGTPCRASDTSTTMLDAIASQIAEVSRLFPRAHRRPDVDVLQQMIETNVRAGLGEPALAFTALDDGERAALEDAPCAAIDGRMLAHEWIRTAAGFTKVDALDHHADHFLPGIQDAGWDLAAAAIELAVPDEGRQRLVNAYVLASGDRGVRQRLRFHERAYLAFRLGYTTLARDTVPDAVEAARFAALARSYSARLMQVLERQSART